jgi:hypothetical protein
MTSLWEIHSGPLRPAGARWSRHLPLLPRTTGDGDLSNVELSAKYISDGLACVVEVERGRAKVGGSDQMVALALRV